jgi:hypothetical protein
MALSLSGRRGDWVDVGFSIFWGGVDPLPASPFQGEVIAGGAGSVGVGVENLFDVAVPVGFVFVEEAVGGGFA